MGQAINFLQSSRRSKKYINLIILHFIFMDLRNDKEQKLMQYLNIMVKMIDQLERQSSFQRIWVMQRRISKQLGKIIIYLKRCQLQLGKKYDGMLAEAMEKILIMLKSSQYDKYSHHFPLFQYIAKKYQQIFNVKIKLPQTQSIIDRIEKNQSSPYFKNLTEITYKQKEFLGSNVTNILLQISNGQIVLQDPNCVCCSAVFIKDMQINNKNAYFNNIKGLSGLETFGQINLERQVSALCNAGGGILIIGAEYINKKLTAVGLHYLNQEQLKHKKQEIENKIHKIKPKINFNISVIRVHSSFINLDSILEEENRICFRVQIGLIQREKLNYVQISKSGFHSYYQFYKYQNQNELGKCFKVEPNHDKSKTYYQLAHQIFSARKKISSIPNYHANINCYSPFQQYSKSYKQLILANDQKTNIKIETSLAENMVIHEHPDDPQIKFQYVTLLSVGSKQQRRYIEELDDYFKAKKYKYQISKPFGNTFSEGSRYIEMMSHYDKFSKVKQLIEQKKNGDRITVIPVFKTIQVYKDKLNEQNPKHKQFQQIFKNRYPQGYKLVEAKITQDNTTKFVYQFNFPNLVQSIYAYLIFQQIQVKAFFIKNISN